MSTDTAQTPLDRLEQTANSGVLTHLPVWSEVAAADVQPGVAALVEQVEAEFDALEGELEPTWAGLMEPLERIEHRLGSVIGTIMHLTSVKYSDELQEAYDEVRPAVIAVSNRMSQSRPVYDAMVALRASDEGQALSVARARILDESIRGMERSGVALAGAEQQRYKEIKERLAELSNTFKTNLLKEEKASRVKVADDARLAGIPDAVVEIARTQATDDDAEGAWHFLVNAVSYLGILQHATDRTLREEMYRAFRNRGVDEGLDNRPVLREILQLRQEQAKLVGFDTYADLSLDAKMAPSTDAVWQLLDQLETAARPVAEHELDALRSFVAAETGDDVELAPWDVPFWSERQREALYSYDAEALRDYFQLPKVLAGLFDLTSKLYGVEITESADTSVPVWDESVQFFEVRRDGDVIAGFYVDPYSRPGEKRGGAWMNTVVGRDRLLAVGDAASSLPVALFVMNARPPAEGRPGLMSLDEVRTLFHEFGHATQHMFTEIDEGGASGMNLVEWDSVELASQFNEYWMEHKPFLAALTAHVDSGEVLDDDTLDRIIDSRNFMVANGTLRQLHFAKSDMALHERFGIESDLDDPIALDLELAQQILVAPRLADETTLPAFGHLFAGGYAAGYYSYKWAEVLAADAFAAFREVGLDNDEQVSEVADRFRETVLGLGGSRPAAEVYRMFRGRDATPDALLADHGLVPA